MMPLEESNSKQQATKVNKMPEFKRMVPWKPHGIQRIQTDNSVTLRRTAPTKMSN